MISSTVPKSLQQVARKLFAEQTEQQSFIEAIINPNPKPTALLWMQDKTEIGCQETEKPADFPDWVSLVSSEAAPGKLTEHDQGKFYCMDPSSVFAAKCLCDLQSGQIFDRPPVIVDLCSSPGGKAIFASRALSPEILICNEVIGSRIPALLSNLKRCKITEAVVTQADPGHFAKFNAGIADLVIVDAPCSGQSLLAKSEKGSGCFSKPVINLNVGRQRRILAEATKIIRAGGYLLYSTCTFSAEENEKNVEWALKNFPHLKQVRNGRMWPQEGIGAGSFFSLLEDQRATGRMNSIDLSSVKHWKIQI